MAIQLHSCYNGGAEGNTRFFICHHRSVAYWKSRFPSARKPANDRQRTYAFRGNMFEPKNEQGTIVFFQQVCHQLGYEIVTIQAAYPDAILHDCNNNRDLRVEFEYNSNNFKAHKHDPAGVDLIICWKKGTIKIGVPILELSTLASYPPYLYQYTPSPLPHVSNSRRERSHKVLVIGNRVHIHKRDDGSEISIIILDGNRGHGIEATKDDNRPSSILLWQAVREAERIRETTGLKEVSIEIAKGIIQMIIKTFEMRSQEASR